MKKCVKCSLEKESSSFYKCSKSRDGLNSWCKSCNNEYGVKKYRRDGTKKVKRSKKEYYLRNKEHCLSKSKQWRKNNKDRHNALNVKSRRSLKNEVISAYGSICSCCRENIPEFLTIDHIDNSGSSHRKEVGSSVFYTWLRKNKFPKENYQLLCMNCNFAKGMYGTCPHKLGV